MQDFDEFLRSLADGCDELHCGPNGAELIQRLGGKLDPPGPSKTAEQRLDELFERRRVAAHTLLGALPSRLRESVPPIEALHDEMIECALFGLNGAAISLSGIFVEFVLKHACFITERGGYRNYDADAWAMFEGPRSTLGPVIERAYELELIDDHQKAELTRFKDTIRNPYNHYNIQKITSTVVFEKVKVIDLVKQTHELRDIAVRDDPVLQPSAKRHVDAAEVRQTLRFADEVARVLLDKLHTRFPA